MSEYQDDLDLTSLVQDPKARRSITNFSTATPKRTKIPVPEHLKFYSIPTDPNAFIVGLYDNMVAYVGSKIPRKDMDARQHQSTVEDTINNFVVYMLAPPSEKTITERGVDVRWKLYDPVKYPDQPYYKWFLTQLDFFRRSMQRDLYRDAQLMTLSESSYESTVDTRANHALNLDTVASTEIQFDVLESLAIREIRDFLAVVSSNYAHHTQCFEKNAFMLFEYRMEDLTTSEISQKLGISTSAVNLWQSRLRALVQRFQADGWGALTQ